MAYDIPAAAHADKEKLTNRCHKNLNIIGINKTKAGISFDKSHLKTRGAIIIGHCVLLPALYSPVAHSAQGRYAQKLLGDLMEDYSNALRPVEDTDKALNVTLQITLSQIKDMVRVTVTLKTPPEGTR